MNAVTSNVAMIVARRYVVTGRVQGVGFRFFTADAAFREQIAGLVRNLPDGSVEVMAEGDADAMTRFEIALRTGPRGARVDRVTTDLEAPTGSYRGFSIKG
jgi:acylphosphatase